MSDQFTDEQAKAILARAIELDSRAAAATVNDLRAIAADLGVSQTSLDVALQEHSATVATGRVIASKRAALAVAGVGLPLGLVAGSLVASGGILAALGVTALGLVASGALVVLEAFAGTHRLFHLKNFALWGGVAAGGVLFPLVFGAGGATVPALVTVGWGVRSWLASSILGSAAMIAVRRARHGSSGMDATPMVRSEGAKGRLLARVARQVLVWLKHPLRRASEPTILTAG